MICGLTAGKKLNLKKATIEVLAAVNIDDLTIWDEGGCSLILCVIEGFNAVKTDRVIAAVDGE